MENSVWTCIDMFQLTIVIKLLELECKIWLVFALFFSKENNRAFMITLTWALLLFVSVYKKTLMLALTDEGNWHVQAKLLLLIVTGLHLPAVLMPGCHGVSSGKVLLL